MRKQLLPVVLLGTLVLACRAAPRQQPPPAPAAPKALSAPAERAVPSVPTVQPPSAVLGSFLDAARTGDHAQAWNLLTREAQAELGPSAEEFASRAFAGLKVRYGLREGYRVALDQLVSPNVGVVAVSGRRTAQEIDAVAAAVVHEAGAWRLSIHGDLPVTAERSGPSQVVLRAPQVNIQRVWLDGEVVKPERRDEGYVISLPPAQAPSPGVVTVLVTSADGAPTAYAFPISP